MAQGVKHLHTAQGGTAYLTLVVPATGETEGEDHLSSGFQGQPEQHKKKKGLYNSLEESQSHMTNASHLNFKRSK
jgi:hypothetical protein